MTSLQPRTASTHVDIIDIADESPCQAGML